ARMTDRSAIDSSTDAEKTDLRPSQPRRNTAPPPQRATNRDFFSSLLEAALQIVRLLNAHLPARIHAAEQEAWGADST
ncbi:MAG: hypothetical protein ACK5U4_23540, partial [Rhodospirillales bacterium]